MTNYELQITKMKKISNPALHCLIVVAACALVSCQRIQPVRTLPDWVRGIYIPMTLNKSTEPGVEEIATRLAQEEFLADGRVRVVQKAQADLQLVTTIKTYLVQVDAYDRDRIPRLEKVLIQSEVKLYDPTVDPFDPEQEPIAKLGEIRTRYIYNSDPRSITYAVEPDVKAGALRQLALQIVDRTINGFPTELKDVPGAAKLPGSKQAERGAIQGDVLRNRTERR